VDTTSIVSGNRLCRMLKIRIKITCNLSRETNFQFRSPARNEERSKRDAAPSAADVDAIDGIGNRERVH